MDTNLPTPVPPVNTVIKKGSHKLFLLISGVIFILLLITIAFFVFGQKNLLQKFFSPLPQTVSPHILDLTSPVVGFSGIIDKIDGDTLLVSNQLQNKRLAYRITVGPQTQILLEEPLIPYSLRPASSSANPKVTIKDLKTGQKISAISKSDLRTLLVDQFEAATITVSRGTTKVNGQIENVSGNTISVKSQASSTEFKNYSFIVTNQTEITSSLPFSTKAEGLNLSDLKEGMQVAVYTNVDIETSKNLTALKINVFSTQTATPSASPKK